MKRKFFNGFIFMMTVSLLFSFTACSDDKEPGGGDDLLSNLPVYDSGEAVYGGKNLVLKAQYATTDGGYTNSQDIPATVNGGKVTIALPATPSDEALFDGIGWSENTSGIDMAHYSFEQLGIGKNYAQASHLELYWFKESTDEMSEGWHWVDAEYQVYNSLREALDAGNKLYVNNQPITYTVGVEGVMNSEALKFTFSDDVDNLTENEILLYSVEGEARLENAPTGLAGQWEATIETRAAGEMKALINKWGVSRQATTINVAYTPPNLSNGNLNRANWMKDVDDKLAIKKLCIPGTHDSGAWHWTNGGMVRCQNRSISEQLMDGIRFLDIRVGDNGAIYHGIARLSDNNGVLTLDKVIDDCVAHLKRYPTETIFVMLTWEHGGTIAKFQDWCKRLAFDRHPDYWYTPIMLDMFVYSLPLVTPSMNLGLVRGKMVLVDDGDTGFIHVGSLKWYDLVKQNEWDIGDGWMKPNERANRKYYAIERFINESRKNNDTFYVREETKTKGGTVNGSKVITYTEANDKMLYNGWNKQFNSCVPVKWYADLINGWFHSDRWGITTYPRGIQLMDFYHQENVDRIIESNPRRDN